MTIRCTCSNEQLAHVECICDAQVNVATDELNRRFDEENARMIAAEDEFYANEEARRQDEARAMEAKWEANEQRRLGCC